VFILYSIKLPVRYTDLPVIYTDLPVRYADLPVRYIKLLVWCLVLVIAPERINTKDEASLGLLANSIENEEDTATWRPKIHS